jgi:CRP/FNR family transcriptional regulator, cyclic AMP receptor protein
MRPNDRLGIPLCWVLEEDPDLTQHLSPAQGWEAKQRAVARALEVGAGPWSPSKAFSELGPASGGAPRALLVLGGVALRELAAGTAVGSVLIGPGELIWESAPNDDAVFLSRATRWNALTDLRLALIDAAFLRRVAPWPQVIVSLLERSEIHADMLALQQTIACQVRVEDRVVMLLLALAERWGRVSKEGIRLDMPLTVTALAQLVAAQRQTVSTAVARLGRQGVVRRSSNGWVVRASAAEDMAAAGSKATGRA